MEGPPRVLWAPLRSSGAEGPPASHSVQEERTGTHTSAQLCCACAWLEGGRGGEVDGFVEWGRRGWVVLEEEEEGKERKTHTANEKNKCTMKKKKTSAAAIIQNNTFNSLS